MKHPLLFFLISFTLIFNFLEVPKFKQNSKLKWVYDNILIPGTRFLTDAQDNGVPFDKKRLYASQELMQPQIDEARRQSDIERQRTASRLTQAGAFGGSRQAILEGMAADTQQRLLGDIQAKGSAQAYQDAINRLQMERQAQGAAAGQRVAELSTSVLNYLV